MQTKLASQRWIYLVSKFVYTDLKNHTSLYILSTWHIPHGQKQALFCKGSPGTLAVPGSAIRMIVSCAVLAPAIRI